MKKVLANKYVQWGVSVLLMMTIGGALAWFGLAPPCTPVPPLPAMGWDEDMAHSEDGVKPIADSLPIERFKDTPAYKETRDVNDVFLWDACKKVTGANLPGRNQGGVGSCVSFGTCSAIEYLMCIQIAVEGKNEEFKPLAQEVVYGGSRVQIGGGRIRGDGSVGAWAAQFVQKYGVIARGKYPGHDLSSYNESVCRQMGSRGCPKELEEVARQNPVKGITQVRNTEECKKALANGYPVAVCSNQGFSQTRDSDGFCRPQGSWAHCMMICGYQTQRKGFFILNSWGESYFRGPVGLGDPSPAGFWAEENVVNRMLGQGDSWAFSDLKGFPGRRIDWFLWHNDNTKHFARGEHANAFTRDLARSPLHRIADFFHSRRSRLEGTSQFRLRHGNSRSPWLPGPGQAGMDAGDPVLAIGA